MHGCACTGLTASAFCASLCASLCVRCWVRVQKMKTRWGSCNPLAKSILINLALAKKPSECLEHIVVHEQAHPLEPTHIFRKRKILGCAFTLRHTRA